MTMTERRTALGPAASGARTRERPSFSHGVGVNPLATVLVVLLALFVVVNFVVALTT